MCLTLANLLSQEGILLNRASDLYFLAIYQLKITKIYINAFVTIAKRYNNCQSTLE